MSATHSTFRVEYARSDQSRCRGCRSTIERDHFRFAIMIFSSKFGGKVPMWYHRDCFFKKVKLIDVNTIKGFDDLRWKDQEEIHHIIQENLTKTQDGAHTNDTFTVQYAKSSRSTCHGCYASINKSTLRLSRKNYTSKRARRFGPTDNWYHVDCFSKIKQDLGFLGTAESFYGFSDLNSKDKKEFIETFGTSTSAKRKREECTLNDETTEQKHVKVDYLTSVLLEKDEEKRQRKDQSELLWTYKDNLRKEVSQSVLKKLLEFNNQKPITDELNLIEAIADCMAFGALESCPECGGFIVFDYTSYRCTGNITEWTKCFYSIEVPKRKPFMIPATIKENHAIFRQYQYIKRDRIMAHLMKKPLVTKATTELDEPDYDSASPLHGYTVGLVGRFSKTNSVLKKQIEQLGGVHTTTINKKVDVIISKQDIVQKRTKNIRNAQAFDIHVVPEQFLNDVLKDRPSNVMNKLKLSTWGTLSHIRKQRARAKNKTKRKMIGGSKDQTKKFAPGKVTLTLKHGAAVDPDSGLEENCHVLKDNKTGGAFTAVLGLVDINRGSNSYYKIQLLEDDKEKKWHLFQGRTGTTFRNTSLKAYSRLTKAIDEFQKVFFKKTGNQWSDRRAFKKLPNKHYQLEIDYRPCDDHDRLDKQINVTDSEGQSRLSKPVQDLIRFIFNIKTINETLLSFEINLTKMPLGKISRNQLKKAYQILSELQTIITSTTTPNRASIIDASNRFYTLIPHDFGLSKPKILDSIDLIQEKTQMIDDLLDIEITYSMLEGSTGETDGHSINTYYEKLKCTIESINRNTEEFKRIEKYMTNTHASTNNQYTLELTELFQVIRDGENDRFTKWETCTNRQLLWHGSRATNFVGILSQGLRIAPPEAPTTGHIFGKGVYFADMFSKSEKYCRITREAPEGLMLLCEVALGTPHKCYNSTSYSENTLPTGTDSVQGYGQTIPNPIENYSGEDGVLIPMGSATDANISHSSLLYNEYIVYHTDQIKMKYLLRIKFHFKD